MLLHPTMRRSIDLASSRTQTDPLTMAVLLGLDVDRSAVLLPSSSLLRSHLIPRRARIPMILTPLQVSYIAPFSLMSSAIPIELFLRNSDPASVKPA